MSDASALLGSWIALRDLSRDQVRERFGIPDDGVFEDVRYEKLRPVDRVYGAGAPGHFYFRGSEQVMLYVPASELEGVSPAELERALGEPAARLRSRAGGDSAFLVYPDRGVAFSTDGRQVEIVEVFRPTSLDDYVERIWEDPGEFYR